MFDEDDADFSSESLMSSFDAKDDDDSSSMFSDESEAALRAEAAASALDDK